MIGNRDTYAPHVDFAVSVGPARWPRWFKPYSSSVAVPAGAKFMVSNCDPELKVSWNFLGFAANDGADKVIEFDAAPDNPFKVLLNAVRALSVDNKQLE